MNWLSSPIASANNSESFICQRNRRRSTAKRGLRRPISVACVTVPRLIDPLVTVHQHYPVARWVLSKHDASVEGQWLHDQTIFADDFMYSLLSQVGDKVRVFGPSIESRILYGLKFESRWLSPTIGVNERRGDPLFRCHCLSLQIPGRCTTAAAICPSSRTQRFLLLSVTKSGNNTIGCERLENVWLLCAWFRMSCSQFLMLWSELDMKSPLI